MHHGLVLGRWRSRRQPHVDGPFRLIQFAYGLDLAFLLHAAVLEPDLDLALGERQLARQLDASTARQVAVELEVLFQLQSLEARVRLSAAASLRRVGSCTHVQTRNFIAVSMP